MPVKYFRFLKVSFLLAILCSSCCGVVIECYYGIQKFHDLPGDQYYCEAELISAENSTHLVGPVSGLHRSGKTDYDVTVFIFEAKKAKFERLPSGIGEVFPNIKYVLWSDGALTAITAEDLGEFPNLQIASFGGNKITSLKSDLFVHTPNITFMWFKHNKIEFVGEHLFDDLSDLREANFLNNKCIDFHATTPESIVELKEALLENCSYVDVPEPKT